MNPPLRLSRLRHPRATAGAIVLLIAAFIVFGAIAEAHMQAKAGERFPGNSIVAAETLLLADNLADKRGDHR